MFTPATDVRTPLRGAAWLTSLLASVLTLGLTTSGPAQSAPAQPAPAPYRFEQSQARHSEPVGWNPCRTIPVRVNLHHAPRGSLTLVTQAIDDVRDASGLPLVVSGRSRRVAGLPHYYGIVISWTSPRHERALAGGVVGLGASSWRQASGGLRHYTRGAALLDAPALRRMGTGKRLAVLEHELGHVMGLAHVRDRHQLMYPLIRHQRGFQAGDRAGLAVLGSLPCN